MAKTFNITPRAKADLEEIWRYSKEHWGEEQTDNYIRALYRRFGWLAANPYSGKHRPEIANSYYSFPHASHLVFYLINGNSIDIIGVVHCSLDIDTYFLS